MNEEISKLEGYREILRNARDLVSHINQNGMTDYYDDQWYHQVLELSGYFDTCILNLNNKIFKLTKSKVGGKKNGKVR